MGFSLRCLLLFQSTGSWALERKLNSCGTWTSFLRGTWDLPGPGIKSASPALAGGFFNTEAPGKPYMIALIQIRKDQRALPTTEGNTDSQLKFRRQLAPLIKEVGFLPLSNDSPCKRTCFGYQFYWPPQRGILLRTGFTTTWRGLKKCVFYFYQLSLIHKHSAQIFLVPFSILLCVQEGWPLRAPLMGFLAFRLPVSFIQWEVTSQKSGGRRRVRLGSFLPCLPPYWARSLGPLLRSQHLRQLSVP